MSCQSLLQFSSSDYNKRRERERERERERRQIMSSHTKRGAEGREVAWIMKSIQRERSLFLPSSSPNHQRWHAKWTISRNMYTLLTRFLHVWHRFCMLSRCLSTKYLHRNSVGSLLRVRCRLGPLPPLLCQAGISYWEPLLSYPLSSLRGVILTTVNSQYLTCRSIQADV